MSQLTAHTKVINIESPPNNASKKILIVDDDASIRKLISLVASKKRFKTYFAQSVSEALDCLSKRKIDVVITDIHLVDSNGIDLAGRVRHMGDTDVIVMTGDKSNYSYDDIVEIGASDFMLKPFSTRELMGRLHRVLRERDLVAERRRMHEKLKNSYKKAKAYAQELSNALNDLKAVHGELKASTLDTINRLALAAEYKDEQTGDHIIRMSELSVLLAQKAGISNAEVQCIRYATPMHDVGKIGIPDYILLKPGKLSAEEFEIMKTHTTIGAEILAGSRSEILQMAHDIALCHHERWDGKGYPRQLSRDKIPFVGRLVAIADVFDALTSKRPYKDPYPVDMTLDIIKKEREKQFDPEVTDLFFENMDAVLAIKKKFDLTNPDTQVKIRLSERDIEKRLTPVQQHLNDCVC